MLQGVRVRDVMRADPITVPPHWSVADFVEQADEVATVPPDREAFEALPAMGDASRRPVVVEGRRVVGVLSASDVAHAVHAAQQAPGRPAQAGGARQFLVSADEVDEARAAMTEDLQMRGVSRLDGALRLLAPEAQRGS